jgi:hypothetical protein
LIYQLRNYFKSNFFDQDLFFARQIIHCLWLREPCRAAESLNAMVMHTDILDTLSQAIFDALRSGVDMRPQHHAGAVVSVRDGKHVCAALTSPLDPMALSRKVMLKQSRRLLRYASFQIALNRSARVCVMFKPSMIQREDPDLLRACIGAMLELADAR